MSVALISGCALMGPKYQDPKVEAPDQWRSIPSSGVAVESGVNLSDISWWTRFNDPTLNNLIEEGLANNSNIQVAIGHITEARGILKRVEMSWVPTMNLGGVAGAGALSDYTPGLSNSVSSITPPGLISNNPNFNYYGAGLMPSYSLNIMQQIKQGDVAKANLAGAIYAKDAVRLTIISQIAGSYFTLLALQEQLAEEQELISQLEELVKLTQIQYKSGYAALTDIQQYQEKLEQAKMQLPQVENNITLSENALKVLINKNPGNIATNNKFAKVSTDGIIPVNLPSSVLRNRPDIMQAEMQLQSANANIGVATSNFFPSINLTTPVGAFGGQFSNLFSPSGDFWATQITATMPILNLGLYGLIKEKKGQYYVAYYNYIATVKSAFAEVDDNFSSYTKTKDAYAATNRLYTISKNNADLNYKNYTLGYMSYPETLDSKITATNNKINLTQMKLREVQTVLNLYQSMAGGYNYKNDDQPKKFGDNHDA